MGDISWTDVTWNPVRGCSRVSEGCRHCYAESMAARIVRMGRGKPTPYDGLVKMTSNGPRWTGRVVLDPVKLAEPLRWRTPRKVFVNSMSDMFHESLTNEQIAAVFGVMAATPHITYQVLTKRARRMREWFVWAAEELSDAENVADMLAPYVGNEAGDGSDEGQERWFERVRWIIDDAHDLEGGFRRGPWPLPNVWIGVSVENQDALARLDDLRACPAAVRFVSGEPLLEGLGTVDLRGIGWWVTGCESGPGARPCDVAWLRSLRAQCATAGVPFFLKQASDGYWSHPSVGVSADTRITAGPGSHRKPGGVIELPYLDGVQHAAFPADGQNGDR